MADAAFLLGFATWRLRRGCNENRTLMPHTCWWTRSATVSFGPDLRSEKWKTRAGMATMVKQGKGP